MSRLDIPPTFAAIFKLNMPMKGLKYYFCLSVLFLLAHATATAQLDSTVTLGEVVVTGHSKVSAINRSAYNVVAVDAGTLRNTTMDIGQALDRISGVKIRETGGVGSNTQVFLNGFSGRHVKLFIDGLPAEGFGAAFRMGNIPVAMADRIEVYKGVVPVELGADALGGAINIVTRRTANTHADVSYSFGSFNTHKANLSLGHTTASGFVFQLNAFRNYSDNSYRVKTKLLDLSTNAYSTDDYWFKRFHDTYHNETLIAKLGVVNKPWASRLMAGVTLSRESAEIQHANLMKIVYGGRTRSAGSIIPSVKYDKYDLFVEHLHFSLTANYNRSRNHNTDSLARQYNWQGEYRGKTTKGEGQYALSEFNNHHYFATANLRYQAGERHHFALNNVYHYFTRKATDAAANAETSTAASFMRRANAKNVLGASYKFEATRRWHTSVFAKYYAVHVTGPVNTSKTSTAVYEEQQRAFGTPGYGVATTYYLTGALQLKASFEKSCRLPSERELFGDEVLETGNAALKPESSRNVNLNVTYNETLHHAHTVYLDAGFIYRDTRDYIRRQIEQRYGGAFYTNHGQVRNVGFDAEARYVYRNRIAIGGNLTWQDMRNREQYAPTGQKLVYYNDRMPNNPYLFGHIDASYTLFDLTGKGSTLSIAYNFRYVHRFFLTWQSEGSTIVIPRQRSHDLSVTWALEDGRYNIAFEVKNMTDELLYDNYSLQKPGRSFAVKLRYVFFRGK
ncbi:MAG: TonB-dependent receptor plug domain-containing protein [Prevotellaceae bacterium]|nr:TonB-dependent receptor plug domain-containing protein [Prevotellaceae bacterium]